MFKYLCIPLFSLSIIGTAVAASLNDLPPQSIDSVGVTQIDPYDSVSQNIEEFMGVANDRTHAEGRSHLVQFFSGTALVEVDKNHPDWAKFRSMAILEATANARESYLRTLNVDKAQEEIKEHFKASGLPEPTAEDFQSESKLGALFDKVVAVAGAKLDAMLDESGIDGTEFKSATPKQKQLLMKQHFATKSIMSAYGDLAGMFVHKTFEQYSDNGKGAVGVVMVLSAEKRDRLKALVEAKGNATPDPSKAKPGNGNLRKVFAQNDAIYLEVGTNIWNDDKGYPLMVAFGQSGVRYSSDPDDRAMETEAAYEFAEDNAWGALAQTYNLNGDFAKESIQTKIKQKEKLFEYKKGKVNKSQSGIQLQLQEQLNVSSSMASSIQGITGVGVKYKWKKRHPIGGKDMVGVVVVWHPQAIYAAEQLQSGKSASEIDSSSLSSQETGSGTLHKLESKEREWDF